VDLENDFESILFVLELVINEAFSFTCSLSC